MPSFWSRSAIRVPALCAALCACALALASCASSATSKNDYIKQVNQIQTKLAAVTQAVTAVNESSPAKESAQLNKLSTKIGAAANQIGALTPPKEWKSYHQSLIDGLHKDQHGTLLMAQAVAKSDTKLQQRATQQLEQADKEISDAIDAINKHR